METSRPCFCASLRRAGDMILIFLDGALKEAF
jgi:hypothetical protein